MSDINLNSFQKHIQTFMNHIKSTGETQVDEKTFLDKITNDKSIFCMLDQNCDGKISEDEILQKGYDVKSDLIKIGHHGSSTSTVIPPRASTKSTTPLKFILT